MNWDDRTLIASPPASEKLVPLDVELRLFQSGHQWLIEIDSDCTGRQPALIAPLADDVLQGIEDLPERYRAWDEFLSLLSPNTNFPPPATVLRAVGEILAARLFSPTTIRQALTKIQAQSRQRIVRIFVDFSEVHEANTLLGRLPIELTFEDHRFLFKQPGYVLLRGVSGVANCQLGIRQDARVLIATAQTNTEPTPTAAALAAHAQRMSVAMSDMGWAPRVHNQISRAELRDALKTPTDVLYIVCHGLEDAEQAGKLLLADGLLDGVELAKWLDESAFAGRPLQLAVLCACSSAVPQVNRGSFSMAQHLILAGGVRMALGFRGPVQATWALEFMGRLFSRLSQHDSLEVAFSEARREVSDSDPQWALPLLFSRRPFRGLSQVPAYAAVAANISSFKSQLPRPTQSYFTGRSEELSQLRQWTRLQESGVTVVVSGEGGQGKTHLAAKLALEAASQGRPVLWLQDADRDLLGAAVRAIRCADEGYQVPTSATTEDVVAHMRRVLAPHKGLMVLDDVGVMSAVEPLWPGAGWSVVITSRLHEPRSGLESLRLRPLDSKSACELFCHVAYGTPAPLADEGADCEVLCQKLGYLPLALELAATTVRNRVWRIADYLHSLSNQTSYAAADLHRIETVLTQKLGELIPADERVFCALGVLPTAPVSVGLVAATVGDTEPQVRRHLERLVRHCLVQATETPGPAHYTLHPLLREAARARARADSVRWRQFHERCGKALADLMDWVASSSATDAELVTQRWHSVREVIESIEPERWLTPERLPGDENVGLALARADHLRNTATTPPVRAQLLDIADRLTEQERDPSCRGMVLLRRGRLHVLMNELGTAQALYSRAMEISKRFPSVLHQGLTYLFRGELHLRDCAMSNADADFSQALELFRTVQHLGCQADAICLRGRVRRFMGQLNEAESDFSAGLALCAQTKDLDGQAHAYLLRSELYRYQTDYDRAKTDISEAMKNYQHLQNSLGQANVYFERAQLLRELGDNENALADYNQAYEIYTKLELSVGQVNSLVWRGNLWMRQANLTASADDIDHAITLAGLANYPLGQAYAFYGRGCLRWMQGDTAAAEADQLQALELSKQAKDRIGQAKVHLELGRLLRYRNDFAGAVAEFKRSLEGYRQVKYPLGELDSLIALGELSAAMALGDSTTAPDRLSDAESFYRDSLELATKCRSLSGQANSYAGRGDVRAKQDDMEGAESDYEQALILYTQAGRKDGQAQIHKRRAVLAFDHGENEQALLALKTAIPLFEAAADNIGISSCLALEACICLKQGDIVQARGVALRAHGLASQCKNDYALSIVDNILSQDLAQEQADGSVEPEPDPSTEDAEPHSAPAPTPTATRRSPFALLLFVFIVVTGLLLLLRE